MSNPDDIKYAEDHEWVRMDGDVGTVGITDYAQEALGDVVFVELPEVGATTVPGEAISEVESTKSVSDIFAPLAGTVTEVNSALDDNPGLVNTDPYGEGWIYKIAVTDTGPLDALMDAAGYEAFTAE